MVCKGCAMDKPITDFYEKFYKNLGKTYSLNFCKDCVKANERARYHQKMKDPKWAMKERERGVIKVCSPAGMSRLRRSRKENPERYRAYNILNRALRAGKIVKPDLCQKCREPGRLHGHHSDYSKPLEVDWLCAKCHSELRIKKAA